MVGDSCGRGKSDNCLLPQEPLAVKHRARRVATSTHITRLSGERVGEFLAFQRAAGRHRAQWSRPGRAGERGLPRWARTACVTRWRAREVGLPPASFARHSAAADPGVVARTIVQPEITAEWSILWSARSQSEAIVRFLESARRCSEENGWLSLPVANG